MTATTSRESVSATTSTSTNIPGPANEVPDHHPNRKEHDTTSSISKTSKYLSATSPHPVTLPTIGTMNTQVGSMYASGDVAASSLAAALSVSVAVIVIAVITTVVVAALVCMKVKMIRAGDNGRELPVDSEQTHTCM